MMSELCVLNGQHKPTLECEKDWGMQTLPLSFERQG
jgi:hypothetical protein